jgi:hypothetical protein
VPAYLQAFYAMNLVELELDDFLCVGNAVMTPADPNAFLRVAPLLGEIVGSLIKQLTTDYSLHTINEQVGDVVLLFMGVPVGCYFGELLAVKDGHKGKSLCVPLVLEATKHRLPPKRRILSDAGRKALIKSWYVANGQLENPWP